MNYVHDADISEDLVGGRSWLFHPRDAVKPFRFYRDPLFVVGCLAYALNRLLLKPHLHSRFLHSHFNDLWLIPCALPLVLWMHKRFGWRTDAPPTLGEVSLHLLLWSALFEWWGPHLMRHVTGDFVDVTCYWIGGLLAWMWWNRSRLWHRFAPA